MYKLPRLAFGAFFGNLSSSDRRRLQNTRSLSVEKLTSRELMAGDITVGGTNSFVSASDSTEIVSSTNVAPISHVVAERTTGDVTGRVYFDANGDGKRQSDEHGIMGVRVHIKGFAYAEKSLKPGQLIEFTTVTDAKGRYSFYDMPPCEYTVTQEDVSGLGTPALRIGTEGGTIDDRGIRMIVRAGVETLYNDFMYQKTANMEDYGDNDAKPDPIPMPWPVATPVAKNKITGRVYFDSNGDGKRQDSEAGIANAQIRIFGIAESPLIVLLSQKAGITSRTIVDRTVTTNEQGCYTFDDLPSGEYTITRVDAEGQTSVRLRVGTEGGSLGDGGIKVKISGGKESLYNDFMYGAPNSATARASQEASGEAGSAHSSTDKIMAGYASISSALDTADELVDSKGPKISAASLDRILI